LKLNSDFAAKVGAEKYDMMVGAEKDYHSNASIAASMSRNQLRAKHEAIRAQFMPTYDADLNVTGFRGMDPSAAGFDEAFDQRRKLFFNTLNLADQEFADARGLTGASLKGAIKSATYAAKGNYHAAGAQDIYNDAE